MSKPEEFTSNHVRFNVNAIQSAQLSEMVTEGLWGATPAEVCRRIVDRHLIKRMKRNAHFIPKSILPPNDPRLI